MPVPAELIVTGPDNVVTRYRLMDRAMIGRHPECEIVVTDPMVGRRHCKVERVPGGFVVEDNKSANGTLLNNEPLAPAVARTFKNGDTIQIGSTTVVLREDVAVRNSSKSRPPEVSIQLQEEGESMPSFDFSQKADAKVISDEEVASSDVSKLKRLTERLKLLVDVAQEVGTTLDPEKLLSACLDKLFDVFKYADRGIIVLYGPDGELPTTLTSENDPGGMLDRRKGAITRVKFRNAQTAQGNEIRLSRTVLKQVRTGRQSVLVSDSDSNAGGGMSLMKFEIKSLMCSPLLVGKDDLGIIQLETKSRQHAFSPDDVGVLTAVAGQIAIVIRNSDLARQAAAQAAHRENLGRFLSPQLLDQVLKGTLNMELRGEEKRGTTFFSDIVGFTKMAGKMNAHDVVKLLNRYFSVMQNIVFKRGGTIDKCAGDEIMAHWGVVGDMPFPTSSAVTAAVEMQIALFDFNRDQTRKNEILLPPTPLGHGIGLNTGMVFAGNIGSERKIEFTVIGDAVNRGSRIAHISGRDQTFIGGPTWEEVKERTFCIRLPDCLFKNVQEPLAVYSVRGIVPPFEQPPTATATQRMDALTLEDILFCLPCTLSNDSLKVSAVVTRITLGKGTAAKIHMQAERPVPAGSAFTLEFNLHEKPSLPSIPGEVQDCWQESRAPGSSGSSGSTVEVAPGVTRPSILPLGSLIFNVKELPADIAAWLPGAVLSSDLKNHEDIIRV